MSIVRKCFLTMLMEDPADVAAANTNSSVTIPHAADACGT